MVTKIYMSTVLQDHKRRILRKSSKSFEDSYHLKTSRNE
jgi:hypothetical protein